MAEKKEIKKIKRRVVNTTILHDGLEYKEGKVCGFDEDFVVKHKKFLQDPKKGGKK